MNNLPPIKFLENAIILCVGYKSAESKRGKRCDIDFINCVARAGLRADQDLKKDPKAEKSVCYELLGSLAYYLLEYPTVLKGHTYFVKEAIDLLVKYIKSKG